MPEQPISTMNLVEQAQSESRKHERSGIDLGTIIEINLKDKQSESNCSCRGLVIDSSLGGCGIVVATTETIEANHQCYIEVPEVSSTKINVQIVWVKKLDENILRMGVEYL